MKKLNHLLLILFAVMATACEKVIDIDLNEKDPKIVIEGIIDNQPGPYYVRITTSVNYDESNEFPPISGASVIVTDNLGGVDTLKEIYPGIYETVSTTGVPGHTYSLNIYTPDGKNFTSVCKMPDLVPFDSLKLDSLEFFGEMAYSFTPYYLDPSVMGNRYRMILKRYLYGERDNSDDLFDDRFNNGVTNTRPVFNDFELFPGDTVRLIKQDVDQVIYDYFNTLNLVDDGNTPANPPSNISNGALGYFSAQTTQTKEVVMPE